MPINVVSSTEQKVPITLNITTLSGKPAEVDGAPTWSVVNGNGTVVPASDGKSAFIVSEDQPGSSVIEIRADADLGTGVQEIVDTINYTYNHPQAANFGTTAGTPEPK